VQMRCVEMRRATSCYVVIVFLRCAEMRFATSLQGVVNICAACRGVIYCACTMCYDCFCAVNSWVNPWFLIDHKNNIVWGLAVRCDFFAALNSWHMLKSHTFALFLYSQNK